MLSIDTKHKISPGSRFADICLYVIAGIAAIATVYPFIYVFSVSISDPGEILKQSVWLFPKGFSQDAYARIVSNSQLWRCFVNSVFYTVAGTFLSLIMSILGAYPLARKRLVLRKFFVLYLIIPMYVSGGLIPFFILINKLGLYNSIWAVILPGMVSIWNIILTRTYFMTLPESLHESAVIDGANDLTILFRIIVPLSKPILAVISLYTAVGIWNSWFNALLFLPDNKLHPLQLFLARILIFNSGDLKSFSNISAEQIIKNMATAIQLKYAVIIFSSAPIICIYPFLQKYFIKGAMIGSLKE